jgi:hypothetical protein
MEFRFVPPDLRKLDETSAELIACSMWKDERPMRGLAGLLDWRLAGKISKLARESFIEGDLGEVLFVPGRPRLPFDKIIVLGLGTQSAFGDGPFREAVTRLLRTLEGLHVRRAVVELPGRGAGAIEPERATEIVLECVGDSPDHDAWWLVEEAEAQVRISARAQDERRRARRG